MQTLQRWLQQTLAQTSGTRPSPLRDQTATRDQERTIIHLFKDRITRITLDFESRHSERQRAQTSLTGFLISKNAGPLAERVHDFFIRANHTHVLKLNSNNVPAAVRTGWVNSLKDMFVQRQGDDHSGNGWAKSLIDTVLTDSTQNKAMFDQLVREVARYADEATREDVVEMELPGDYRVSCEDANRLLDLFSSTTAKCDVLVALYGAITDKESWPELLRKTVASEKERESVAEFVRDMNRAN
jgi:hypothetical protein